MLDPQEDGGKALRAWRACWRLSWEQLQPCLDRAAILASRRDLFFCQALRKARHVLEARQDLSLRPLIRAAVREGCPGPLLATLDQGECTGKPVPPSPALWLISLRALGSQETLKQGRDAVECTWNFVGSFILVCGEFGERLRPRTEPLGPWGISKPFVFCSGLGCGWLHLEAQAHRLGAQP